MFTTVTVPFLFTTLSKNLGDEDTNYFSVRFSLGDNSGLQAEQSSDHSL